MHQVDRELLEAFRDAGCWAILFGAESGVQKNLDALRKGITLEQTRRAVRAAKAAGLAVHTPFLFGIPGQTWEDGLETIRFACELDPDIASFHALTPFPGSELWERRHELGTVAEDLASYTYQGAAFVPHTMTRDADPAAAPAGLPRVLLAPGLPAAAHARHPLAPRGGGGVARRAQPARPLDEARGLHAGRVGPVGRR